MSKNTDCSTVTNSRKATGEPVSIIAADGHPLVGRLYQPIGPPKAVLLGLPGIGVPQRVFRHVGPWLAERGVTLVTVDYRGIGDSCTPEGVASASLSTWALADAVGAQRYVRRRYGASPVLLAHSFGGQMLGMADELHDAQGAILVGSQLAHRHHWDGLGRLKIEFFWRALLPSTARLFDPVPKWVLGEALPAGVAREWRRWALSPDWLLSHVDGAAARYARFDRAIRAYGISDDDIAPPRAVGDLLSRFRGADVTRVDVTPDALGRDHIGHLGLFRPDSTEMIWEEWLRFATTYFQETKSTHELERKKTWNAA
ncbi:MAG: alpha/beta hydrolase [Myxococcota bacterium]